MRLSARFLTLLVATLAALAVFAAPVRAGGDVCGTAPHSCFTVNLAAPGCDAAECCETVCIIEPICCEVAWDELCVAIAVKFCSSCGTSTNSCFEVSKTPGCDTAPCCEFVCAQPGFEYCCDLAWDAGCVRLASVKCRGCGAAGGSPCTIVHEAPGCADADCCAQVCVADPQCCSLTWDQTCVEWAAVFCPSCGGPTAGSCCFAHAGPFCDDPACCDAVCKIDSYCCETSWDKTCVEIANAVCGLPNCLCGDPAAGNCKTVHINPGCSDFDCCNAVCTADPYCCIVTWDYACTRVNEQVCSTNEVCGVPGSGSCFVRHPNPGCDDAGCCQAVCKVDPLCCQIEWDQDCADTAEAVCTACGDTLAGSCFEAHGNPACADTECCSTVCAADPLCCELVWDGVCVVFAEAFCDKPIGNCGTVLGRSCYLASYLPGCDDAGCCVSICLTVDPFCCEVRWDAVCAEQALSVCGPVTACPRRGNCLVSHSFPGCNDAICCSAVCEIDPLCCSLTWDTECANYAKGICFGLDACPGDKPCTISHSSPGCEDPSCCNVVCAIDPLCCIEAWDSGCVTSALTLCQPSSNSNCPCAGSCFDSHTNPGCEDPSCCAGVCQIDPGCCSATWDDVCVAIARQVCCGAIGCGNWCAGSCFVAHAAPFCSDAACCEAVCIVDPFCCISKWDGLCADLAEIRCGGLCGIPGAGSCFTAHLTPACQNRVCCDAVCAADPFCCDGAWDDTCVTLAKGTPADKTTRPPTPAVRGLCELPKCGDFGAGPCCQAHESPACNDRNCCSSVCSDDPFCCDVEWDESCAGIARGKPACNCVAECGDPCAGSCCEARDTPLCDDEKCCSAVCAIDPFCCELAGGAWDNLCVSMAFSEPACEDPCPSPPCGDPAAGDCCSPHFGANCSDQSCCKEVCGTDPFCCDVQWDFACAITAGEVCTVCESKFFCGSPASGSCFDAHGTPFCDDAGCCALICTIDEACCANSWDQACADLALSFCAP